MVEIFIVFWEFLKKHSLAVYVFMIILFGLPPIIRILF